MAELEIIKDTARQMFKTNPDPVIKFRLLRDVLKQPTDNPEIIQAKTKLSTSRWVQELKKEQWNDGSWGRFHSMDYKAEQKIPTTEYGVSRALALGLDISHPILQTAGEYITCILDGTLKWRDRREVSWSQSWWDSGVQLISASTLAQIQPDLPILNDIWNMWFSIIHRAFPSGKYNREHEIQANLELRGIKDISNYARRQIKRGSALDSFSKYHAILLGSRADSLPHQLEKAYLTKIWNQGMGYLGVPPATSPAKLLKEPPSAFEAWLSSIELLTPFSSWREFARSPIDWLWEQRSEEGFWDFGPRSESFPFFPLSESWRKKKARRFDWTTRVLILVRKYYASD